MSLCLASDRGQKSYHPPILPVLAWWNPNTLPVLKDRGRTKKKQDKEKQSKEQARRVKKKKTKKQHGIMSRLIYHFLSSKVHPEEQEKWEGKKKENSLLWWGCHLHLGIPCTASSASHCLCWKPWGKSRTTSSMLTMYFSVLLSPGTFSLSAVALN